MKAFQVGGKTVGPGHPCFVIAEAGVNHNGDLAMARRLVEAAAEAGADAVKFQLYDAAEQVSRAARTAGYQRDRTGEDDMLSMAAGYDLPWEAHFELAEHCRAVGIHYMSSVFDRRAADFLLRLGGDAFKIGSGELTNEPLLRYLAGLGKPILLSTGMSTLEDVAGAVERLRAHGDPPLLLFQCVSCYPAPPETANLRAMAVMAQAFGVPVGFSDHTPGSTVAVAAVALGASMVEKHFTLDRTLPGPDHAMSLSPAELREYVAAVRDAEAALGDGIKRPHPEEIPVREVARRGLVSGRDLRAGEVLGDDNVAFKRPALGIDPRFWETVRGRRLRVDVPADTPVTWEMLA